MRILFALFLSLACLSSHAQDLSSAVASGINSIRRSNGLGQLRREPRLESAAKSQSDWMLSVGRMDHMRDPARSLDEYRVCNYHPANRVVNSGYYSFDELFRVDYNPDGSGAQVHPRPVANTHVGEIVAAGWGGGPQVRRPDIILNGWMNSPGHRQAILTPHFRDFGVGVSSNGRDVYWCVVFGAKE